MRMFRSLTLFLLALAAFVALPDQLRAQDATGQISGVVADSSGRPLVGAQVTVEGTSVGRSTAADGRYTLQAPVGQRTLRVRRIGFIEGTRVVTVATGAAVTADFRLVPRAVELERMVSTGYQEQTKASVTGAVSVMGGEELAKRPVSNITKGLQGTMPGVTVQDFGGRPGADAGQIRIRGVGTLGNSGALVLVDGVPSEFNNINPLEIESITVLKDAASAAIYGARAANGVMLIKTRRGQNIGGFKVSYDGYYASQEAQDMPERVDIRTEMEAVNAVYVNAGQLPKYRPGQIDSTASGIDPLNYPNTNWLGLIYRTAPMANQTLSIRGGNDLATLSVTGNYFDQQGILNTDNFYKRLSTRANSNFNITKRLSASADIYLMDERVRRPNGEGNAQFRALHDTPPTGVAVYEDGSYGWLAGGRNPLAFLREDGWYNQRWRTGTINTGAVYAFDDSSSLRGLKFSAMVEADNKDHRELRFLPSYRFSDRNAPTVVRFERIRPLSADYRQNRVNTQLTGTAEYLRTLGDHSVRVLGGYDQRVSNFDDAFAQREGAYNNDLQLVSSGDVAFPQSTGGAASTSRLIGTFGRIQYNFKERYNLEGNVRRDGSSRFGSERKYGVFPSVSAAWNISQEPWLQERLGPITNAKLRGSWGRLGNDQIGDYLYQQTININSGNYQFGNALSTGATPGRIANPEIGWETTETSDIGLDVDFLDGKLAFVGDVYKRLTTGILQTPPISSLVGQQAPVVNSATMSNRGWEAAVNWRDNVGGFDYGIGFNISDVRNRIEKLPAGDQIGGGTIRRVGEPMDALFGVRAVGIFQDSAEVAAWPTQTGATGPGDLKYHDANGDGKIDANDRIVIGDPTPRYTWGTNLNASFKGIDFSMLLNGVGKRDAYMDGALIEGPTWENFFPEYLRDSWTPENRDAAFPRFVFRNVQNHNAPGRNSWWMRDAGYVSLRNVQVGYSLPARVAARAGLSTVRVYVGGANLYTWSELKGLLPAELNPDASRGTYYYQTKQISVGANFGM